MVEIEPIAERIFPCGCIVSFERRDGRVVGMLGDCEDGCPTAAAISAKMDDLGGNKLTSSSDEVIYLDCDCVIAVNAAGVCNRLLVCNGSTCGVVSMSP